MVGSTSYDEEVLDVNDEFPHMILMTAEWKADKSHNIFKTLYGEGG